MWAGFAVPFVIGAFIGLHSYYPQVPAPLLAYGLSVFRKTQTLNLRLSFPMIGFFYLVDQQTSFSLWFFNLLFFIIRGCMNILHIGMTENLGIYGARSPVFAHLGVGAFIAMVGAGVKVGGRHFSAVWRRAFYGDPTVDDSGEMMSYRRAVIGLLVGGAVMVVWLTASGIPFLLVLPFLLVALLLFVGLTRVVAESGMAEAVAPSIAPGILISAVGSEGLREAGPRRVGHELRLAQRHAHLRDGDSRTRAQARTGVAGPATPAARDDRRDRDRDGGEHPPHALLGLQQRRDHAQ